MDFPNIKVEKFESLSKEDFDAIPVLGSNGVTVIDALHECQECQATMIEEEQRKNEGRKIGSRSSKRIQENTLSFYTTQVCTHNLYLDIAEEPDVMKVSWPRSMPKWIQLFNEEYSPCVDNSSKFERKRKIENNEN